MKLKPESLIHELMITAFDLDCHMAIAERPDLHMFGLQQASDIALRGVLERRYHLHSHRLTFTYKTEDKVIEPDGGFLIGQQRDQPTPHLILNWLEMDNGTMSPDAVYRKLRTYADFYEAPEGRQYIIQHYQTWGRTDPKPKFRLLLVLRATDRHESAFSRLTHLYTAALELPDYMRDAIWFTTVDDLNAARQDQTPALTKPIWWRGRGASDWIQDYRTFLSHLAKGRGHKTLTHRRQYVAQRLERMNKHHLLPQRYQPRET